MLTVTSTHTTVAHHLVHANTFWRRLRGLMFRSRPLDDEALLLTPCQSVHTCFMRFPIDVVFADADGTVVAIHAKMPPFRATRLYSDAHHVFELPSGTAERLGLTVGDQVSW